MPDRVLRWVTDLIVQCCDPDQVLLFGSVAKGRGGPGSDLDILVIGDFKEPRALRGQEIKGRLAEMPIRVDLLLLTPEEVEVGRRNAYSFISTILWSTRTLYTSTPKNA